MKTFFIVILFLSANILNAYIYRVHPNGNDANDGKSWNNAFATLQKALDVAMGSDEIWIAEGVYKPTSVYNLSKDERNKHFRMSNGVSIYGGFPPDNNPSMDDRDWVLYKTILSGDLKDDDYLNPFTKELENISDNCYSIFYHPENLSLNNSAILDGVTIRGANANGSIINSGGGMHNFGSGPKIRNVIFEYNRANGNGGAFYNNIGRPMLLNCIFRNNYAGKSGGGIFIANSTDYNVINSLFIQNIANFSGGGIEIIESSGNVTNCTVSENYASVSSGFAISGNGATNINNSIIYYNYPSSSIWFDTYTYDGDVIINYKLIINNSCFPEDFVIEHDSFEVYNSINVEPGFAFRANKERFSLTSISPCIDAGKNEYIWENYDIRGPNFPRRLNPIDGTAGIIDMGAYEYNYLYDADEPSSFSFFVNSSSTGEQNGHSWENAFTSLSDALKVALPGEDIWVAEGIYKPDYDWGLNIGERGKHFRMKDNVNLYGGFPAQGNPTFDERNPKIYKTILCGDLNDDDVWNKDTQEWANRDDNCYHVFYHPYNHKLSSFTIIDGFTIRNGHADYHTSPHNYGGGIYNLYSSPTIYNCIFENNFAAVIGGAICNISSDIIMDNCQFIGNTVLQYGGAIYNAYSIINLKNSRVMHNIANSSGGGIMFVNGITNITNCVIAENSADFGGGFSLSANPAQFNMTNCTIANNTAIKEGGGMEITLFWSMDFETKFETLLIQNSIIYGNNTLSDDMKVKNIQINEYKVDEWYSFASVSFENCLLEKIHSYDATVFKKCIDNQNPRFLNQGEHPYMLNGNSIAIDEGNNEFTDEEFDIRGEGFPRKLNKLDASPGIVDIGAYEYYYGKDIVSVKDAQLYLTNSISIYPNPVSNKLNLNIETEFFHNASVSFYNLLGQQLLVEQIIEQTTVFDLSNLVNGTYICIVNIDGTIFSKVFTKIE